MVSWSNLWCSGERWPALSSRPGPMRAYSTLQSVVIATLASPVGGDLAVIMCQSTGRACLVTSWGLCGYASWARPVARRPAAWNDSVLGQQEYIWWWADWPANFLTMMGWTLVLPCCAWEATGCNRWAASEEEGKRTVYALNIIYMYVRNPVPSYYCVGLSMRLTCNID